MVNWWAFHHARLALASSFTEFMIVINNNNNNNHELYSISFNREWERTLGCFSLVMAVSIRKLRVEWASHAMETCKPWTDWHTRARGFLANHARLLIIEDYEKWLKDVNHEKIMLALQNHFQWSMPLACCLTPKT